MIEKAPCEAEAQCCALVKAGKVYAVGTEDMDALTFGADVLLRHLTFSEARKMPIKEFHYKRILEGLSFTSEQVKKHQNPNLNLNIYFILLVK